MFSNYCALYSRNELPRGKLRGIKPVRFRNLHRTFNVICVICEICGLKPITIYDPNRCSIGYHPLHSYPAIFIYLAMTFIPKTRLIGLGLLIHMALDGLDCIWMFA